MPASIALVGRMELVKGRKSSLQVLSEGSKLPFCGVLPWEARLSVRFDVVAVF